MKSPQEVIDDLARAVGGQVMTFDEFDENMSRRQSDAGYASGWYVETTDLDGVTVYVRMGDTIPTSVNYSGVPDYKNGMTEKQAKGYAELFGGEAKEIK